MSGGPSVLGSFAAFTAEHLGLRQAKLDDCGLQVESAGVVLMESITRAFEPLTKTDGSEHEKLRPKLRYNEKNMAVYIIVVKGSQVGHHQATQPTCGDEG